MLTAFVPCLSVECFYEIHLAITHVHYLYYIIFSVSFVLHLVIRRFIVLHLALIAADRSCRCKICAMCMARSVCIARRLRSGVQRWNEKIVTLKIWHQ